MMYQVGVTGGIGSGKTLVCQVIERLGVPVYYADIEARRLMNSDAGLIEGIRELFGDAAFRSGKLDRGFVAGQVFGDPVKLDRLNSLVHPAVRQHYTEWMERQTGAPYVVEEAAILIESGASKFLDRTVLVFAPESLRIRRVMERDRVPELEVRKRMMHQMNEEMKKDLADDILLNDGRSMLLPQIIQLHNNILNSIS